jgi:hypothetical protein
MAAHSTGPAVLAQHPHIAHELPVLAVLRLAAESSTGPNYSRNGTGTPCPASWAGMHTRLGESSCRTGKHVDWPARSRHLSYHAEDAVDDRQTLFCAGTARPAPVDPVVSVPVVASRAQR